MDIITFPKNERDDVQKRLEENLEVSTVRVGKEFDKYLLGEKYETEWGDIIEITKQEIFQDIDDIPTLNKMSNEMVGSIKEGMTEHGAEWLHFKKSTLSSRA